MSAADFDAEAARLQAQLAELERIADPAARTAARGLVRTVLGLHAVALADLLAIVREAGSQPADTLAARFLANPGVRGLLLLHGLHPEDLASRARHAVVRLNLRLGAHGLHAELLGVEHGAVRLRLDGRGGGRRLAPAELETLVERGLLDFVPDAAGFALEGLETVDGPAAETHVPLAALGGRRHAG